MFRWFNGVYLILAGAFLFWILSGLSATGKYDVYKKQVQYLPEYDDQSTFEGYAKFLYYSASVTGGLFIIGGFLTLLSKRKGVRYAIETVLIIISIIALVAYFLFFFRYNTTVGLFMSGDSEQMSQLLTGIGIPVVIIVELLMVLGVRGFPILSFVSEKYL